MIDFPALDAHLAAAARFVSAGNKQRALEEIGDARALVRAGNRVEVAWAEPAEAEEQPAA